MIGEYAMNMKIKRTFIRLRPVLCLFLIIVIVYNCLPSTYTRRLISAIRDDNIRKVHRLLKLGVDVNRRNTYQFIEVVGNYPLSEACITGNIEIIRMLMAYGASVNPEESWTPLTMACTNYYPDRIEIIKLLIENGADVNRNESGETPIIHLVGYSYDRKSMGLGFKEADKGKERETYEIFMLLIENGAEIFDVGKHGKDILVSAALHDNLLIMKYLVEERHFNVNIISYTGKTPLIYAVSYNLAEMTEYLLSKGADKSIKDTDGKTALDYANEKGYMEIIKLLS